MRVMKQLSCSVAVLALSVSLSAQTANPIAAYVNANQQPIVRELVELLSIPNVAADRPNIKRNADLLRAMFLKRGFNVDILATE